VAWEVDYTDEFGGWWTSLTEAEHITLTAAVEVLEEHGPSLGYPKSSEIKGSRHGQMRELRIQHKGRPYRILYAFDPRRVAILLIGGDKTGNDNWYTEFVPIADNLYDVHLKEIAKERKDDG